MSVVRVTEITASSTKGFEDAVCSGIQRAGKTLDNIKRPGFKNKVSPLTVTR